MMKQVKQCQVIREPQQVLLMIYIMFLLYQMVELGESKVLSLYGLATFMQSKLKVKIAYNLDGGGSSTMYFNGNVINNPTTNGKKISERSVSDIVYVGY